MDNGLGVRLRAIAMPLLLEGYAQFFVVVYFAVENNPHRLVFIGDGLVTGAQIDDAQSAHGETHGSFDVIALVVRSAMNDLPIHGLQHVAIGVTPGMKVVSSTDSAHD
jgi:hypothetical protein